MWRDEILCAYCQLRLLYPFSRFLLLDRRRHLSSSLIIVICRTIDHTCVNLAHWFIAISCFTSTSWRRILKWTSSRNFCQPSQVRNNLRSVWSNYRHTTFPSKHRCVMETDFVLRQKLCNYICGTQRVEMAKNLDIRNQSVKSRFRNYPHCEQRNYRLMWAKTKPKTKIGYYVLVFLMRTAFLIHLTQNEPRRRPKHNFSNFKVLSKAII